MSNFKLITVEQKINKQQKVLETKTAHHEDANNFQYYQRVVLLRDNVVADLCCPSFWNVAWYGFSI